MVLNQSTNDLNPGTVSTLLNVLPSADNCPRLPELGDVQYQRNRTDPGEQSSKTHTIVQAQAHAGTGTTPNQASPETVAITQVRHGLSHQPYPMVHRTDSGSQASSLHNSTNPVFEHTGFSNPTCPLPEDDVLQVPKVPSPGKISHHSSDRYSPKFDPVALATHSSLVAAIWPTPTPAATSQFPEFCHVYSTIKHFNLPNAVGARVTLPSGLHLDKWELYLRDYHNKEVCAFLRYGWLVGYSGPHPPASVKRNHPSGTGYKEHVREFIDTELKH